MNPEATKPRGHADADAPDPRRRPDLLELIFTHVAEAILVTDRSGRIVEANPAAATLTGYSIPELLALDPWAFLDQPTRDEIPGLIATASPGTPVPLHGGYHRKSGESREVELRFTRFGCPDADSLVVSLRDTTEQTRHEKRLRDLADVRRHHEELRRLNAELEEQAASLREMNRTVTDSEQRLRLAIATGRIGLWVWNSTDIANAGDWSDRLKEIFGLPLDVDVTHDLFLSAVHPEDRERVNQSIMDALGGNNGGEYTAEYRSIHPEDHSLHWVTARGQAFFGATGVPVRFIGTVMDITERKLAEESSVRLNIELEQRIAARTNDLARTNVALQMEIEERKKVEEALNRQQDNLRLVIDTIPTLVWSALPDGHIEYLNKRWLDFTGLTLDEANGWGWVRAVHPDDLPGLVEYWKSILASGEAGAIESRLRRHDGEYRWFLFLGVPLKDEVGKVVKWYGTNTDVNDRRASEHLARGQFEALTRTLDSLAMEEAPDRMVEHVLRAMADQLDAFRCCMWLREEAEGLMVFECAVEDGEFGTGPDPKVAELSPALALQDLWPFPEIFAAVKPSLVRDIREAPPFPWLPYLADQGVVTILAVPMVVAGRVDGLIGVSFRKRRELRPEEMELAQALANQAMLATKLTRLSAQSRQAAVIAERNRMAREIHDTLAQGFTGVIVQAEAAEDAISIGLMKEAGEHLDRLGDLARESLREARRSVMALRPQALEKLDLCSALADLFTRMTARTPLAAEFTREGTPRPLAADTEENLLRICQEVLTNALRHSRARRFSATLRFEARELRMAMADDGRGFDPEGSHDGFGLTGIRERVVEMGGELAIHSTPGDGSRISIVLPG